MRIKKGWISGLLFLAVPVLTFSDPQISFFQYFAVNGAYQPPNSLSSTPEQFLLFPQVSAALILVPEFDFSEDFQSDSRLDVIISKSADKSLNAAPQVSVKEAFVDLLFMNSFRLRGGYIKNELGYNSGFHPLAVTEMSKEFSDVFTAIKIGNMSLGEEGLPAFGAGYNFTLLDSFFKGSFETLWYFLSLNSFEKNFLLGKLTLSFDNFAAGLVAGGRWDLIRAGAKTGLPNVGAYLSYVSPFGLVLSWEGLLKDGSFHPFVDSGSLSSARSGNSYVNQSLRAVYSITESVFKNTLAIAAEYFSYGEGLTYKEYQDLVDYYRQVPTKPALKTLFIANRNFQNYASFALSYDILPASFSFQYQVVLEGTSWTNTHLLQLSKSIRNATLSAAFVLNSAASDEYLLPFDGLKVVYGVTLSLKL